MRRATLEELLPAPAVPGMPQVDWGDAPENPGELLYQTYDNAVAGATVASLLEAAAAEPRVTRDIVAAMPAGSRTHGLAARMKSPSSLAAKIARKVELDPAASAHDVSAKVTDLLRYTAVSPSANELVPMVRSTVDTLAARGWSVVEAEHTYVDGNPYKGVHVIVQDGESGVPVEIQFHTEQSIRLKDEVSHPLYKVERDISTPRSKRARAREQLVSEWDRVPQPAGIEDLTTIGGQPVRRKANRNPYDGKEGRTR